MKYSPLFRGFLALLPVHALMAQDPAAPAAAPSSEPYLTSLVSDGTEDLSAPKKEIPRLSIQETTVHQLPNRRIIMNQVVPPALPEVPAPLPAADVNDPAVQTRLAVMRENYRETNLIFVCATVYDHQKTFIRWWPAGGAGKEISGWSNLDWNHLCGFSTYVAADANEEPQNCALLLAIGDLNTALLRQKLARQGIVFHAPETPTLPDLATYGPAFVVTGGDASDAQAMAVMNGLHELYRKEGERLRLAWIAREEAARQRAEFLRLNPPAPGDTVIQFWPRISRRHATSATQPSPTR